MVCRTDLSTRADGADLPPVGVGATPRVVLLQAEAEADTWRLVELASRNGLPFDAHLAWSAAGGVGAEARVTVARAARVSVFARALRVSAENLCDATNRVVAAVADGHATTRNTWEQRLLAREGVVATLEVPPFAEALHVSVADPSVRATTLLRLRDGLGDTRALVPLLAIPPAGLPIGGARGVELLSTRADVLARAVFHLSL